VFSQTLQSASWGPAEIFGDLGAAVAELKARDDPGTILVHGGPDLARSMVRLGLVDEYQLSWVPIAIGSGHSPFAGLEEHLKLELVHEQRFASGAHAKILVPSPPATTANVVTGYRRPLAAATTVRQLVEPHGIALLERS
jgi:dihydrofolate reductase